MFHLLEEIVYANTNLSWSTITHVSMGIYSGVFIIWVLMTFSLVILTIFYFFSKKFKNYYNNKLKSLKKTLIIFYSFIGILVLLYRNDTLIYNKFFVRKIEIDWKTLEKVMSNCEIDQCGRNVDGYGHITDDYIYCDIRNSRHKYIIRADKIDNPSKNILDLIDTTKKRCEIPSSWIWVD